MKKAYIIRILIMGLILLLPLSRLNTTPEAKSDIDNKFLTDFPTIEQGFSPFLQQTNDYLTDRLGGRERLLQWNATFNDKLFGYLDHPSYEYGKGGYVFPKLRGFQQDFEFLDEFTDFLLEIQNYCHDRGIPFVYQLNPAKWSVYPEFLPSGYNYHNERLAYLQSALVDKGIVHVDATNYLKELSSTEQVFNRQFDAGHWNATGAFYSVNQLLEKMQELEPTIQLNDMADYIQGEELVTEHAVSKIKIHEYVPTLKEIEASWDYTDLKIRREIMLHPQHRSFYRTQSDAENQVDLLMFHGSGFNGKGHPYIAPAVSTYQGIHNYQNLIDFDYYFNLFQPNFVVVNSAEYATTAAYFSRDNMAMKQFNPPLIPQDFTSTDETIEIYAIDEDDYTSTIWLDELDIDYGYFFDGTNVYDLIAEEDAVWFFTAMNDKIDLSNGKLFLVVDGESLVMKLSLPVE